MSNLTWRAEYLLGILYEEGESKIAYLEHASNISFDLRSVINSLIDLGFVAERYKDKRTKLVSITDYGKEYIQLVKDLYGESS